MYEVVVSILDKGSTVERYHTYLLRSGGMRRIDAERKALRKASWRFRGSAVRIYRLTVR